jgi:hypothetical protein
VRLLLAYRYVVEVFEYNVFKQFHLKTRTEDAPNDFGMTFKRDDLEKLLSVHFINNKLIR